MKKKFTAILTVLLAALLLCGNASPVGLPEYEETEVRFEDMEYERPDPAAFQALADQVVQMLEETTGYRRTVEKLDELFAQYIYAGTMLTLADIHNSQDLTDDYWAEEYGACLSALTEIYETMENVFLACGASPYAARLEREYFGEGFMAEYGEDAESMLSEEYVRLLDKENELITEYRELIAEPAVMWNGKERSVYDIIYDAETDRELDAILHAYYEKYNSLLGELYLRMMEVRKAQARELGYDSYAEMMFDSGFDRDFTIADANTFVESVKKWVLPVYARWMDFDRRSELTESYVDEADLYRVLEAVAHGLGGEVAQAYDFMMRNNLCDLAMSDTKADISFQNYLDWYDAPFLFVNPYGDMDDVLSVTHEFGHYAEAYISYGAYRSMDLSEVFSQTMQFLALIELGNVLGPDAVEDLRLLNLYKILEALVWQSAYAEFEERAFDMEEPTVEKLNALMNEIGQEYGLDEGNDPDFALTWTDITHFFEEPFYVISYPVSACCALEIYERELADGSGLDDYLRLMESEEIGLLGAAEEAGLQNPVTDARVQDVAAFLEKQFAA